MEDHNKVRVTIAVKGKGKWPRLCMVSAPQLYSRPFVLIIKAGTSFWLNPGLQVWVEAWGIWLITLQEAKTTDAYPTSVEPREWPPCPAWSPRPGLPHPLPKFAQTTPTHHHLHRFQLQIPSALHTSHNWIFMWRLKAPLSFSTSCIPKTLSHTFQAGIWKGGLNGAFWCWLPALLAFALS